MLHLFAWFIASLSFIFLPHPVAQSQVSTYSENPPPSRVPTIDMPLVPGSDMTKTAITLAVNVWVPYDSCSTQPAATETKPLKMDFGDGVSEKLIYQGVSCSINGSANPALVFKGANHTYQSRGIYTVTLFDSSGTILRSVKVQN